ncbi:MAG TPA: PASTA domain-containing protein [Candidatus Angelobacter sp.]
MRKLFQYLMLGLVLLLVFLASALLSMRFAIHGRQVRVPRLSGLTFPEAERMANSEGLALTVENRFYSAEVPVGRIISQYPAANSSVRRGWKVAVAESLGPQRAAVPNLVGQSRHAAGINLGRRGLEIGSVATVHLPGAAPQTVVAQSPRPDASDVASPRIGLVLAAVDNEQRYVMPSFIGKTLAEVRAAVEQAGLTTGKKPAVTAPAAAKSGKDTADARAIVVKQYPQPGQRVAAGATVYFEVKR